jgi:hypothetical protein
MKVLNLLPAPFSLLVGAPARTTTGRAFAVLAMAAVLVCLGLGGTAAAAGPGVLTLKTPSVDEKSGEWHIKVRIDLARAPSMMHTPMRFTFSKEAVDERAIMAQGAEPQHHRMVIDTPAKQIQSLDVDFADASGKIFKSTIFEFDLRRKEGYFEAGEYTMQLSGPDGDVGVAQKLVLKGDNPPVYRGAMDFSSNDKGGKGGKKGVKIQSVNSGVDGGSGGDDSDDKPAAAAPTATDVAAEGHAPSMVPDTAFGKTKEEEGVKDHPQGCGCIEAGMAESPFGTSAALVLGTVGALALVVARRSRRSSPRFVGRGPGPDRV